MEIMTKYECPICKRQYLQIEEAKKCLNSNDTPIFKVGDIVEAGYGFGWFDGDKDWLINPEIDPRKEHGFCKNKSWGFYYVVSHIDLVEHEIVYYLVTGAMSLDTGYSGGKTKHMGTHKTPKLINNPPKHIIEKSKQFIGLKPQRFL